jgi:dihydrofolate reductase
VLGGVAVKSGSITILTLGCVWLGWRLVSVVFHIVRTEQMTPNTPPDANMLPRPRISLIAAVTSSGGIGKNNALLWHEPADQKHFRQVTMGCPVIMGRKTWDSLPQRFRPLAGRTNIVITRQPHWQAPGALVAHALEDALMHAASADKVFVIGGAEIYALALPLADELVLTEVAMDIKADAFFPAWKTGAFVEVSRIEHQTTTGTHYAFVTYVRIKPTLVSP